MDDDGDILTVLKILIIGESDVGKSSLLLRFTEDTFNQDTPATIGMDFKTAMVNIDGNNVKLAIWDTAGSERFRSLTPNFYRGAHGAILVYDVTRRESFEKVDSWYNELEMYSTRNDIVKMLVGNKIDKCSGKAAAVAREDGLRWARKHSTLFIESSAKTSEGVKTAFEELVQKILETPGLWEASSRRTNIRLEEQNDQEASWCASWCGSS
ncbi:Ras-related protein Rab-18-B [Halotydeus destructor]|nr:Ras-related protein Rab-18-B [Halotydeus destructor]